MNEEMKLESLPEECIALVLSGTSPRDACQFSLVSTTVRDAAESELLWENFLPSDYPDIISRSVFPLIVTSKRELFMKLMTKPLLIDAGNKTFCIDKLTNKKCYMLSARELSITWARNHLYWCWKYFLPSRFPEVAELIMVTWLDIQGKINTKMLSPNTTYAAYLVLKLAGRAFGLETIPSEVSVEVGNNYKSCGKTYLERSNHVIASTPRAIMQSSVCVEHNKINPQQRSSSAGVISIKGYREEIRVLHERQDGWLELELGEFYNDGSENEVKMSLREVKGEHLKGGIILEGIEIRPKY